jgi:hypothetical protein
MSNIQGSAVYGWENEGDFDEATRMDNFVNHVCSVIDSPIFAKCVYASVGFFSAGLLWQIIKVI